MAAVSPTARAQGVTALPRRSEAAFADLYDRHAAAVRGFCTRWLRSRDEADDAVQTSFLLAWRALEQGVVPAFERAWLLSIAKNVCLSTTEARKRRSAESAHDPHTLEEIAGCGMPAEAPEPRLPAALAALTDHQRRAIVLREWHGLSYREIATELELSQSAVETLLFRARRTLARQLRKAGTFLPWFKSFLGGAAAKLAVGATIAAVVATADLSSQPGGGHAKPMGRTPVSGARVATLETHGTALATNERVRPRASHRAARRAAPTTKPSSALPVVRKPDGPPNPATRPVLAGPVGAPGREPVAATTTPAAPAAPAAPVVASVTQPAQAAVDTVADTATNAATTAAGTVNAAQSSVDDTTAAATGTVQQTISNVTSTVEVPPVLPPTPNLLP